MWWEKRRALVNALLSRGHRVDFANRMTKQSAMYPTIASIKDHDMLIIEFGSANKSFYGEDIAQTIKYVNHFHGPKIFINDDPDLSFFWKEITNFKNWSCWFNCLNPIPLDHQPRDIPIYDMPFSSAQIPIKPLRVYDTDKLVYIGRPVGRSKAVKDLITNQVPWVVYGRQDEWDQFGVFVKDPPTQPERADFYASKLGSICLADKKHKSMRWRTGRAYHSIIAGCPTIVEESHDLPGLMKFKNAKDLKAAFHKWRDPDARSEVVLAEQAQIIKDVKIAEKTLAAHGL